jgi:hypothetical protein
MTPKEKAKELYDKYCNMESWCDDAKECALIAVDEILLSQFQFDMISIYRTPFNHYWQEVKTEIEKL